MLSPGPPGYFAHLLLMNIHPRQPGFSVSPDHAQEFPAVSLVKRRVVCKQIKRVDSFGLHVRAGKVQHLPGDTPAPVSLLDIDRADIRRQVFPVMEVVFNHTQPGNDGVFVLHNVPLRHGAASAQALFHAMSISLGGDAPFRMKPFGGLIQTFGMFRYFDDWKVRHMFIFV